MSDKFASTLAEKYPALSAREINAALRSSDADLVLALESTILGARGDDPVTTRQAQLLYRRILRDRGTSPSRVRALQVTRARL